MAPKPDKSPIPLYHQIAESIRYQIATGVIDVGSRLPTVRDAAQKWGVNLHTVRHAYSELAKQGLVESNGARGTTVISKFKSASSHQSDDLNLFIQNLVKAAHAQFGLKPAQLAKLITEQTVEESFKAPTVHIVECSETQCKDHAQQVAAYLNVEACQWCLSRKGEPPSGPMIATYFHFNEVRRRWPHRLNDILFATIRPELDLAKKIDSFRPARGKLTIPVCEFDESMAFNIAADLTQLLPDDHYNIEPRVLKQKSGKIPVDLRDKTVVLFAPRVWDTMSENDRNRSGFFEVIYEFPETELKRIGQHFGWEYRGWVKPLAGNEPSSSQLATRFMVSTN